MEKTPFKDFVMYLVHHAQTVLHQPPSSDKNHDRIAYEKVWVKLLEPLEHSRDLISSAFLSALSKHAHQGPLLPAEVLMEAQRIQQQANEAA